MSICKYCGKPIMRGEVWNLDENGNGYHHACLIEIEFDESQKRVQRLAQKSILDKIRAEIEQHRRKTQSIDPYDLVGDCLDIIDKYRAESEE